MLITWKFDMKSLTLIELNQQFTILKYSKFVYLVRRSKGQQISTYISHWRKMPEGEITHYMHMCVTEVGGLLFLRGGNMEQ